MLGTMIRSMAQIWNGNSRRLLTFLLFVTFVTRVTASYEEIRVNYARSATELRKLAHIDFKTMKQLQSMKVQKQLTSRRSKIITEYLEDFANCTSSGTIVTQYAEEVVRNPLLRFKLIRRVVNFFRMLKQKRVDIPGLAVNVLKEEFKGPGLPLKDDLSEAIDAILHIHFTYDLNATDLAAGKLRGLNAGVKLLAINCLSIGYHAKTTGQFTLAIEWLSEAARLARIDGTTDFHTVQAELMSTIRRHNWEWENDDYSNHNLFMRAITSAESSHKKSIPKVKDVLQKKYAGKGTNASYWSVNTWGLCSDQHYHTPEATSHLFCWLEFKVNKVFAIAPLKLEFLSRNPDIVHVRDIFREDPTSNSVESSSSKTYPKLGNTGDWWINKKMEAMTGLRVTKTVETEVTNQLPGIRAEFQVDSLPSDATNVDRIASVMIYMNDVEQGGNTAFPAAFATALPTRGSAIFWVNVLSDGTTDLSTAHADCPVVFGNKLVAHKFISYHDQLLVRKCLLKPKERFRVRVNGKAPPIPSSSRHELIDEQDFDSPETLSAAEELSPDHPNPELLVLKYSYTSAPSLKSLVRLDWEILRNVKQIFKKFDSAAQLRVANADASHEIEMFQSYLQDFNQTAHRTAEADIVDLMAWNPIAVFRTLWRFENYVKKWITNDHQQQLRELTSQIRTYLANVYNVSDGPKYEDLQASILGILTTQHVNDLHSIEIARGILAGIDTGVTLSAEHSIEFGRQAILHGFYYQAVTWMEVAVNKIMAEADSSADLKFAQSELEISKKSHDLHLQRTKGGDHSTYAKPVVGVTNTSSLETNKEVLYNTFNFRNEAERTRINYMRVCQGKSHQTAEERGRLFCWHETEIHPYWKIGPLKMEFLSMHPKAEVVQYHDLLPEKLLTFLWHEANSNEQQYTLATNRRHPINAVGRITATYCHYLDSSEQSKQIMKLVNKATGLTVLQRNSRAALKISSYTAGSHFSVHPDSVPIQFTPDVSRIATLIFYLNNVKKGGETAFAQAGARAMPKRGSAIFWYNMLSSGDRYELTYHGGCPVMFGEKFLATQWMYYSDQDHLQCHPDQSKRFEVLVNGKSNYGI